jgi:hypothetical protein
MNLFGSRDSIKPGDPDLKMTLTKVLSIQQLDILLGKLEI